jgi:4-amino-4-deoxy-L-arabinose transferase-like glycosyltransferase
VIKLTKLFQFDNGQPVEDTAGAVVSEPSSGPTSGPRIARTCNVPPVLFRILGVGLVVRLLAVLFLYTDQLAPYRDHYEFGWEVGRVAQSVAEGRGFASPLFGDTGPTAWLPPMYVYLLAGVFRLLGVYTPAAAIAILTLNSLFSALTAWPIVSIAEPLFGRKVAVRAGWVWAFFPYAIFIAATRVWGECLDALLVSAVVLISLRMAEINCGTVWLAGGLLTGLTTLINPNTLSLAPALWGWGCWSLSRSAQQWTKPLILASVGLFAVVAPWFLRNTLVFNELLPFRSNFWLEVYVGNNPEAPVMLVDWNRHPASNSSELAEYRASGELAYMKAKREQALAYIGSHPATFATMTLRRVAFVWTGFWSWNKRYLASEPFRLPFVLFGTVLSLFMLIGISATWHTIPSTRMLVAILVCQPVVYYITHPAPEYRHAVDPVIAILATVGATAFRSAMAQMSPK